MGRTKNPIITFSEPWEENGVVSGKVVFPSGFIFYEKDVYLIYGAGDKFLAFQKMSYNEMLDEITNYP